MSRYLSPPQQIWGTMSITMTMGMKPQQLMPPSTLSTGLMPGAGAGETQLTAVKGRRRFTTRYASSEDPLLGGCGGGEFLPQLCA